MSINSVIIGTGSYIPETVVPNDHFLQHTFYKKTGERMVKDTSEITAKLQQISGIKERRYAKPSVDSAYMAAEAGRQALEKAQLSGEDLDAIIVAHNAGNMVDGADKPTAIPNLASLVKRKLGIVTPNCIAYDIVFGCPGWIEGMTQAHRMLAMGDAANIMVIGVEILSRMVDKYDLDTMLFGDGAGATILQAAKKTATKGIIAYQNYSHCGKEVEYLKMDFSYKKGEKEELFMKMEGKQVYRYAVTYVPELINNCLKKNGIKVAEVDHFLFHQANEKMIIAMSEKLFKMNGLQGDLDKVVPMTVQHLGNTSVATIPTLMDLIYREQIPNHQIKSGDLVVMASVGAGMHANCMIYRA